MHATVTNLVGAHSLKLLLEITIADVIIHAPTKLAFLEMFFQFVQFANELTPISSSQQHCVRGCESPRRKDPRCFHQQPKPRLTQGSDRLPCNLWTMQIGKAQLPRGTQYYLWTRIRTRRSGRHCQYTAQLHQRCDDSERSGHTAVKRLLYENG